MLFHPECATITVSLSLLHHHCSTSNVEPLLFHYYCSISTVPSLLFHHYCSTITVPVCLFHHYCSTMTAPPSLFSITVPPLLIHHLSPSLFHQVNYLACITSISWKFMRKSGQEQNRKKEVQVRRREEKQTRASVFFFPLPSPPSSHSTVFSCPGVPRCRDSYGQGFKPGISGCESTTIGLLLF